jgi:hypothetical protein
MVCRYRRRQYVVIPWLIKYLPTKLGYVPCEHGHGFHLLGH